MAREINPQRMDKLSQQFVEGDRVRLMATRWTGRVLHVVSKDMESTGDPGSGPLLFAYDVVMDADGSMVTLYDGLEPLDTQPAGDGENPA